MSFQSSVCDQTTAAFAQPLYYFLFSGLIRMIISFNTSYGGNDDSKKTCSARTCIAFDAKKKAIQLTNVCAPYRFDFTKLMSMRWEKLTGM